MPEVNVDINVDVDVDLDDIMTNITIHCEDCNGTLGYNIEGDCISVERCECADESIRDSGYDHGYETASDTSYNEGYDDGYTEGKDEDSQIIILNEVVNNANE